MDSSADTVNTPGSENPSPSIRIPASTGPAANPIGPRCAEDGDGRPEAMPWGDVTDAGQHHPRVAELEPDQQHRHGELPRLARQGDRRRRPPPRRRALRTITTLRLYLSAQAPQSGTMGAPTTKISELNRPTNASRSVCCHAHLPQVGRQQREDLVLTPIPSTIEVIQKIATSTRQSCRGRAPGVTAPAATGWELGIGGSLADGSRGRWAARRGAVHVSRAGLRTPDCGGAALGMTRDGGHESARRN